MKKKGLIYILVNFAMTIILCLSMMLLYGITAHAECPYSSYYSINISIYPVSDKDSKQSVFFDSVNVYYPEEHTWSIELEPDTLYQMDIDYERYDNYISEDDYFEAKVDTILGPAFIENLRDGIPEWIIGELTDISDDGYQRLKGRRSVYVQLDEYGNYTLTVKMLGQNAKEGLQDYSYRWINIYILCKKSTPAEESKTFYVAPDSTLYVGDQLKYAEDRYNFAWIDPFDIPVPTILGKESSYTPTGSSPGDIFICRVSRKNESTTTGCIGSENIFYYTFNIKPRAEWTIRPTGKNLTYTGSYMELINPGTTSQGTIQYSTDGTNWTTDIPSKNEVGDYSVYCKIVPTNENYVESESILVNAKIDKAIPKTPTNINAKYGMRLSEVALPEGWKWENPDLFIEGCGTYTFIAKYEESSNYKAATAKVSVQVDKGEPECQAPEAVETLIYTGLEHELITAGTVPAGCTMEYKLGEDKEWSEEIPKASAAGIHTVYWKVVGNEYYNDYESPMGVIVKIQKATPTITWENQTTVFTNEEAIIKAPTVTFLGEDNPEVDITYSYRLQGEGEYTDGLPSGCGIYNVKATVAETDNYGVAEGNMLLTITCKDATGDGLCDSCNGPMEPAIVDGYYQIANKGNLMWFANQVNAGQTAINAKLTADINMSDIDWTIMSSFAGTFDGNGHTILKLCADENGGDDDIADGSRCGLFQTLSEAGTVTNLTISGAQLWSSNSAGAIAAENNGTISKCIVKDSTIQLGLSHGLAVIAGTNYGTVTDCGVVNCFLQRRWRSANNSDYAIGVIVEDNSGTVSNCFSYGCTFSNSPNMYAIVESGNAPVNCYYYTAATVSDTVATSKTTEQFASGEVAFLLNGSTNFGNVSWYQKLSESQDIYPVLNSTHGTVYYVFKCDSVTPVYRNVNENESHVDDDNNGYCDVCEKTPTSIIVDGKVELKSNELAYGKTLSELTFKSVRFVDSEGKRVAGTLRWDSPDARPDMNTKQAVWVFIPKDEGYQAVRGTIAIVVNKAVAVVTVVPTVDEIKYDSSNTLSNVGIIDGTVTGVDDVTLSGEWSWKTPQLVPEAKNNGYVAIFTPQDETHYEKLEVILEVPVRKAEASLTIEEGKTFYDKSFTADDFELTGISHTGDSTLTYTVKDEKTIDGEEKEAGSVITVSDDGIVSVIGTGSANIYVGVSESDNYLAVTPQIITVNVGLEDGFFVEGEKEYIYTGKAIKPAFIVYDGLNGELVAKKDYTISYKNNTKAYTLKEDEEGFDAKKAPQAIIKGKGSYSANITVYFTILPKDISKLEDESIVVKDILLEENGKVQKKVPSITYNGKKLAGVLKPENGSTPAKVKDFVYSYVYSYPNMTEEEIADNAFKSAGTWKILVEGTGNYTGERYVDVVIATKGGKMSSAKIKSIPTQEYTGEAIELAADELQVTAKINGKTTILERGIHYDVLRYKNNTEIGTATVILTGIPANGFSGSKTATFKIVGSSIAKASVTGIESKVYSGNAQTQDVAVTLSKKVQTENGTETQTVTLIKDKDYTVSYDKNVNVGTAKMTIKGMGAYTGTIKKTFKITAYDMKGETDAAGNAKKDSPLSETNGLFTMKNGEFSVKYVKGGAKPAVKLIFNGKPLTEGKDYTLSYKNNANVYTLKEGEEGYKAKKAPTLTIKGKGNFKGSVSKTFIITGRSLTEEGMAVTMTVADKAVSTKNGGYISKPILTDKDGKVLKQGKDYSKPVYTMTDEESKTTILSEKAKVTTPGSVITVTVEGIGAYAGTKEDSVITGTYRITEKNFTGIKAASISKPYTGSKVILTEEDFYTVDNEGKKTSKITIGSGKNKKELQYGVDFEIVPGSYKNNIKKGTASVTLRGISDTKDGGSGLYGGTKTIKFKITTRGLGNWFWWQIW